MPSLALITVLYKSDEVLEDFFSGISKQDFKDYKLYLIDNSANSFTTSLIQELLLKYPVSLIEHFDAKGNIGVAAGNNIGIKKAIEDRCDYFLFLNNDIFIPDKNLFSRMIPLCAEHKIVTPKIFYHDNGLIWMAGGYMNHWKALGVHYGMNQKDGPAFNVSKYVTYAPTCFLLVHASVIKQIGIMDEQYFAYYDDTDFVYRAGKYGIKVWYEHSLYITHKVSSSSGGDDSMFYIYYGNRNKLYFIKKHYKGLHKLYLYLYYCIVRYIKYYLRFDSEKRKQLIRATKDGFAMKTRVN
jgi:GT2 family glycosyltransferase